MTPPVKEAMPLPRIKVQAGQPDTSAIDKIVNFLTTHYERAEVSRLLGDGSFAQLQKMGEELYALHKNRGAVKSALLHLQGKREGCYLNVFLLALFQIKTQRNVSMG